MPAVLRFELEVQEFILNSSEPQLIFKGDMTSYDVSIATVLCRCSCICIYTVFLDNWLSKSK